MARPIPLELPPRDPRAELHARLQNAPLEHAEALLEAYEVLQGLHDRGLLDMLRGALGSGDKVLENLVEATKTPGAIRATRNLLILAKAVGTIDPELLRGLVQAVPQGLARAKARESKPPGLWALLKNLLNKDSRRALTAMTCVLEAFGKNLSARN